MAWNDLSLKPDKLEIFSSQLNIQNCASECWLGRFPEERQLWFLLALVVWHGDIQEDVNSYFDHLGYRQHTFFPVEEVLQPWGLMFYSHDGKSSISNGTYGNPI